MISNIYLTIQDRWEDVSMAIIFISASLVGMKMLAGVLVHLHNGGVL